MNQCLVTKMKSSVDDDSLIKINEFYVVIEAPARTWGILSCLNTKPCIVRVPSTSEIKLSEKQEGEYSTTISCKGTQKDIFIYNTSDITKSFKIFISEKQTFVYLTPNTATQKNNFFLKTTSFANENLTTLPKISSQFPFIMSGRGTIADLVGFSSHFAIIDIQETNIIPLTIYSKFVKLTSLELNATHTGDISILGTMVSLNNLAFGKSNCSGTIENLVKGFRNHGRTTGTITGNSSNVSKVTFNGLTSNAVGSITWTETTITMNNITISA